ncbi:MAG: UDP-2,3-diacylglucosamine diphosphatase LpxI [Puniceicoccales bacterium]|jgi:DUF1009 family protein|nr:UDP-2,3-diacylglucosamine diphosphatase LpxI [Puniceicoccales bacterium]
MERFLPKDFNGTAATIAIIAGRGEYPKLLAQRILALGIRCRLIALEGETSPLLWEQFSEEHRAKIRIGQLGKALRVLRSLRISDVILAGQIKPLRFFKDLHPDIRALCLLRKIKERNGDTIFSTVCGEIERIGIRVLDSRSFMDPDVVCLGKNFPLDSWIVNHGIHIASEVARLDIGQSVVVKSGTVIQVEGFDGTDAMIRRVQSLGLEGMLLVKASKPHHDFRFDVPIFGMQTLELMHIAGIHFAALEADRTIILNQAFVLKRAKEFGIKIFGY